MNRWTVFMHSFGAFVASPSSSFGMNVNHGKTKAADDASRNDIGQITHLRRSIFFLFVH